MTLVNVLSLHFQLCRICQRGLLELILIHFFESKHLYKFKPNIDVFHILEDKHTLVAGFKARFRIKQITVYSLEWREGKFSYLNGHYFSNTAAGKYLSLIHI